MNGDRRAERLRYPYVLFDAGETLIGPRESYGAVYARVLAGLGLELPRDALDRAVLETYDAVTRTLPAGVDRYSVHPGGEAEFWLRFCGTSLARVLGHAPEPGFVRRSLDSLREAFQDGAAWRVYPEVPAVLEELRRIGCRLAVVSNWDSRLPGLLERLELRPHFDALAVSHLEGVEKPDPRLFRIALERLGAPADRSLHVGNVFAVDVVGARAAGIDGLLVDRRGAGATPPPCRVVSDLSDLPRIGRDGF